MPFQTKQQCVQAMIKLERAKRAMRDVIDALGEIKDLAKDVDHYVGYDMDDKLYQARRLESDLDELRNQYEAGPDVDDDGNELEPIYRAEDARHEANYGPRD